MWSIYDCPPFSKIIQQFAFFDKLDIHTRLIRCVFIWSFSKKQNFGQVFHFCPFWWIISTFTKGIFFVQFWAPKNSDCLNFDGFGGLVKVYRERCQVFIQKLRTSLSFIQNNFTLIEKVFLHFSGKKSSLMR